MRLQKKSQHKNILFHYTSDRIVAHASDFDIYYPHICREYRKRYPSTCGIVKNKTFVFLSLCDVS